MKNTCVGYDFTFVQGVLRCMDEQLDKGRTYINLLWELKRFSETLINSYETECARKQSYYCKEAPAQQEKECEDKE